jgi:hypothetical protein
MRMVSGRFAISGRRDAWHAVIYAHAGVAIGLDP